jgi:hypothetical protein
MSEWIVKLLEQWDTVKAAPIPFTIAIIIAAAIIWVAVEWSYRGILGSKNAQIELQDRQLADYRDKLKGASPEEAKAKIDALESTIRTTIGSRWKPLTQDESARLTAAVAPLPKRRIQVMYGNQLGKDLAQSIADAFTKAGWTEVIFSEGGGLGIGVSTGRGNGMALTLKRAIETATKFKVASFGPDEPDVPSIVFVGVGINPD